MDELRKQAEESQLEETEGLREDPDPRSKREWTFLFDYTDARGTSNKGNFTHRILEGRKFRRQVEQLEAQLAGGIAFEVLSPDARTMNRISARLSYGFTERPKWAADMDSLDDELLIALYDRAQEHEDYYFRRGTAQAGSAASAPER